MKWTLALLVASVAILASTVKVVDHLGFPLEGVTVCGAAGCATTNASGMAKIEEGPVEVYVEGLLVWRSPRVDGDTTVSLYRIEELEITPIRASGELVIRLVRALNGTYADVKYFFRDNNLTRPLYVGNVNHQVEVYISRLGTNVFNATVKTSMWELAIDLVALGYVNLCRYNASSPITRISILAGNRSEVDREEPWFYVVKGVSYVGVAYTTALLPNGSSYAFYFDPVAFCNKTLVANVSRLTLVALDSFGTVRNDWIISVAGRHYRGQAELWVAVGYSYDVLIDAGFDKKKFSITPLRPTEVVKATIDNAFLLLNYKSPASKVFIIGNYTYVAAMPRKVELPPGLYQVVVEIGGRNVTYIVRLSPGEVLSLTVGGGEGQVAQASRPSPATYAFVAVVLAIIAVASLLVTVETLRRRRLRRGQSRS